ncbi:hypothetical protein RhiJN_28526 [Ceratobasidium sp. AG-Ba]|nr:hypothetical protein RhiJN_28526 [Ceratobasidium sp. AG-Ba]
MRPNLCPSTPSRVSASGKLGAAVRHSPYAPRHAATSKSGYSKHSVKKASLAPSVGASLRPTFSMLEEFEVDNILGPGLCSEDSVPSLSYASSSSQSDDSLDHCPSPTGSVDHLRGYIQNQISGRPLARDWSTATTVLELPGGPSRQHPSYGLESFSGSESSVEEEKMDEMSWVATTSFAKPSPCFMPFRSYGSDSETDSENVSMEEIVIRVPLPTPLDTQDSTETLSSSTSSSPTSSDGLTTPSDSPIRKRIWEVRADDYVPRPQGAPPQSVASVLEIGMQWERAHQAESPRSKDEKREPGAVGHIRRVYGDAQYMN